MGQKSDIPHLWRDNNSKTQLRAPSLHKGEILKLLPTLPLGHHQPSHTISHHVRQAVELSFGHLSGPTRLHKITLLTLKEGDLPDKVLYAFMSRRQCCGVLHLPPHHILR
jgi:hypothetical protein